MIEPAPTTKIDPTIARGVFEGLTQATGTKPAYAIVSFPNTDYRTYLVPTGAVTAQPGKRVSGTVQARARRIDSVLTGGRYVEPVYGHPRRVQGSVIAVTPGAVVVNAGFPIHCTPTDPRQKASDFQVGDFVSFDVMEGASLSPSPQ
ncbi:MAG: hypothetical protein KF745_05115 [Phycisphaeraceae bacterium]|nr:hypothetical protein [Phycisphaeraceae bacterium]